MRKNKILWILALFVILIHQISFAHAMNDNALETYGDKAVSSLKQRREDKPGALFNNYYEDTEFKKRQRYDSKGNVTEEERTARLTTRHSYCCSYKSMIVGATLVGVFYMLYRLSYPSDYFEF